MSRIIRGPVLRSEVKVTRLRQALTQNGFNSRMESCTKLKEYFPSFE